MNIDADHSDVEKMAFLLLLLFVFKFEPSELIYLLALLHHSETKVIDTWKKNLGEIYIEYSLLCVASYATLLCFLWLVEHS